MACAAFTRLLEAAAQSTGDECFGLRFGEHYQPKNIGPLAYVVLNSPTFAAALENIGRYFRAHNEAARVAFSHDAARLEVGLVEPAIEIPRQHNEYGMAVALGTIRLMAGSQWVPAEVQFSHPAPRDTAEHVRVFRSPVSFGCAINAFLLERDFVERPVPAADPRLYPILRRYLDHASPSCHERTGYSPRFEKPWGSRCGTATRH
jgi:Arabinose-binding domain of AraC transcription regulator, N-term